MKTQIEIGIIDGPESIEHPMSNEEFRERIAAICGPKPASDKPIVRGPSDRGYHPPMHRCAWCGHMNHIVNECRCDPHNLPTSLPKEAA